MAELDRDYLLDQLEKLGSEDDATVLAAARAAHRHVEESGFVWDDVLEPDEDDYEDDDDAGDDPRDDIDEDDIVDEDDDRDDYDDDEEEADAPTVAADDGGQSGEEGRLIAKLLAHRDVTDDTREDLAEMQSDYEKGKLSAMDRRFVRALAKRLDVR